jgi:hypothetical protein
MRRKPPKNQREKFYVDIESDTAFSANARLLQSLWRERNGFPIGYHQKNDEEPTKLGSLIELNSAKKNGSNFLTKEIANLVKKEICHPEKVIQEPRIWNNLLSSQPLAFNLFGELKEPGYETIKAVLLNYFPGEIEQVEKICFEHSPGRRRRDLTNDSSAFDVFIEYRSTSQEKCFIGIEVKYAENMRDEPAKIRPEYDKVANDTNLFRPEAYDQLRKSNIQQLWRDHLLAASMFISKTLYQKGKFIVLYPEKNRQCYNAITKYKDTFKSTDPKKSFFYPITLENFLSHLKETGRKQWISDFESRYLDFGIIEQLI